ncbi:MAG: malonyl-CoA decarboxylase [Comamonadaceae bacterium]|nr:malonyl-CoA decarboxylase [Comamonadaceae bacterium]
MSTPTPSTEPSIASRMGIMRLWRRLVGTADAASANASAEPLDKRQWQKIDALLQEATSRADSDTRVRARARRLLDAYQKANAQDRLAFMLRLAQGFHIDEAALEVAIAHWQQAARSGNAADKLHAQTRLAQTLESPRMHILRQFNLLPAGIEALVRMRAELLGLREHQQALQPLESDLLRLLTLWFDAGFLELQRIGWSSPASLLEKVIRYEAVHEIKSWDDLRNRLDSDRRCYAFFHGRMPEEPLIFVEVALVQSLASSVQALLDEAQPTNDPAQATTAIFYSISNAQPGLRGVSMGEFLIKRVVEQLTHEFPKLQTFATLSPVPGFGQWLRTQLADAAYVQQLPAIAQRALADQATDAPTDSPTHAPTNNATPSPTANTSYELLQTLLASGEASAHPREEEAALKQWLMGECAHYLLMQKRKQEPLDAVARFHFGNGASLQQINWMGDSSAKGLRQSLGLMVNYLYRLDAIDEQYHAYARQGLLAHSSEVKKLLAANPIRREG